MNRKLIKTSLRGIRLNSPAAVCNASLVRRHLEIDRRQSSARLYRYQTHSYHFGLHGTIGPAQYLLPVPMSLG
jgi:hypothetical protein